MFPEKIKGRKRSRKKKKKRDERMFFLLEINMYYREGIC